MTEIPVQDYSIATYRVFLEYLYSDKLNTEDYEFDPIELLKLSHQFSLDRLQIKTEVFVSDNIDSDNVCGLFELSCIYGFHHVSRNCQAFVHTHPEVTHSEDYHYLSDEHKEQLSSGTKKGNFFHKMLQKVHHKSDSTV